MAATSTLVRYEDPLDVRERSAIAGFLAGYSGNTRVSDTTQPPPARHRSGELRWLLLGDRQAEVATDVIFRDRPSLTTIMPDLVRHATLNLSSADVLHFLGRKLHPHLAAEVLTDAKRRPEGWRVKHRLARNWVAFRDTGRCAWRRADRRFRRGRVRMSVAARRPRARRSGRP
jgi:hypothetical protein